MPQLVFLNAECAGQQYELAEPRTRVGRGDSNDLIIRDREVSRLHCEIHTYRDEVLVKDLGSLNGTVVNGRRICGQQAPLHHGQIVQVGSLEARLELDPLPEDHIEDDVSAVHAYAAVTRGRFPYRKILLNPIRLEIGLKPCLAQEEPTLQAVPPVNLGCVAGAEREKRPVGRRDSANGPWRGLQFLKKWI